MNWHKNSLSLQDIQNKIKSLSSILEEVEPNSRLEKNIIRQIQDLNRRKELIINEENKKRQPIRDIV